MIRTVSHVTSPPLGSAYRCYYCTPILPTGPVNPPHFLSLSLAGVNSAPYIFMQNLHHLDHPPSPPHLDPPLNCPPCPTPICIPRLYYYQCSHPDQDFARFFYGTYQMCSILATQLPPSCPDNPRQTTHHQQPTVQ